MGGGRRGWGGVGGGLVEAKVSCIASDTGLQFGQGLLSL